MVCIVWSSLRYTKNKRIIQKTIDKNVNTRCYLTSLGGFHFPPLMWPELLQRAHIMFIIRRFIWPKQVSALVMEITHLGPECHWGLGACENPKLLNEQPLPLRQPAPMHSASPFTLGLALDRKPRQNLMGLEELIFSTVWGQKITDLFF